MFRSGYLSITNYVRLWAFKKYLYIPFFLYEIQQFSCFGCKGVRGWRRKRQKRRRMIAAAVAERRRARMAS
jgi:hypothetical protein